MKISRKEIINAILENDTARVAEILEAFGLRKDGSLPVFTSADKKLVTTMLGFASAKDLNLSEGLSDDLAEELIERTAMTVDIFEFMKLIMIAVDVDIVDYNDIPNDIREALVKNKYSDEIARAIESPIDDYALKALIDFIATGQVEEIHIKFNLPIIRRVYGSGWVTQDEILAFMGLCLRETVEEHFDDLQGVLSVLGGLDILEAFLGSD